MLPTSPLASASPAPDSAVTFASIALIEPLHRALHDKNYLTPSPIQAQAIPSLLLGRDLIGLAQTGTGKTAAFALPILHRLSQQPKPRQPRCPRALVMTPTRELAGQVAQSFTDYGKYLSLTNTVIFGGVGQTPQIKALQRGVDIVVGTPGRLLDLHQQGHLRFDRVEIFVLDEVDRMLDMGFVHDVKKVVAQLPAQRQSLLFSATLPPSIVEIADRLLRDPVRVEVTPVATTAERIEQRVCFVARSDKPKALLHLLKQNPKGLVIVFSRTKHGANRIAENLTKAGHTAEAIHGNKSQNARERALENFRTAKARVLVATDIAARGIDVKGIELVVNYDVPDEPESYVHRIGRTARAGASGVAYTLCEAEERDSLRDIQKLIRQTIPVFQDHPYHIDLTLGAASGGGSHSGRRGRGARSSSSSASSFRRPRSDSRSHSASRGR